MYRFLGMVLTSLVAVQCNIHTGPNLPGQVNRTTGEKKILGFVQTATENEPVCAACLREVVARGLRTERGLLCVSDDAKGLRKAIQTVCGRQAVVQRCQWHTREKVVRYLPKGPQATWRRLAAAGL